MATTEWGEPALADTSAWGRAGEPAVASSWTAAIQGGDIVTCQPVVLEILRSARSLADFERLDAALDALRSIPVGETTLRAARTAQHELARSGEHRMPPFDVLVAAAAAEAGVAVLHYDRHFDTLSRVLGFRSIWIASPGSLD